MKPTNLSLSPRLRALLVASAITLVVAVQPALAQETAPGDVCTVAQENLIRSSGGPESNGDWHLIWCDGAEWTPALRWNASVQSVMLGRLAIASGDGSVAWGGSDSNVASGEAATVWGSEGNTASGLGSTAWGSDTVASNRNTTAWGSFTHAGSLLETSLGRYSLDTAGDPTDWVATDILFEIGNGTDNANRSNALTVLKNGNTGVGIAAPDTKLDVAGNVSAEQYCDEDGDNCFAATDVAGGGGSGVWETDANVTRPASGVADYANDDFVFGSQSLDNVTGTDDDNRMFFDKSKGAFRSGFGGGTNWNASTASVGLYSMAWGPGGAQTTKLANTASGIGSTAWGGLSDYSTPNVASGDFSTAWGSKTAANGIRSTAWGDSNAANGGNSTAWGSGSLASGNQSTAWGMFSTASVRGSTAWGNNAHAGSFIETSLGQYPLNTAGNAEGWIATDTLFEIGNGTSNVSRANALTVLKNGNTGVGTASPQSALHVPDGKYLQVEDNNAGAPPAGDCDADNERGRLSLNTTDNRLHVCMGAARGWDHAVLVD